MILSKDSNNNWVPTATGNGTFIGTTAAFNAIKDTLPVNTVAYITDDGNGDLQPIDAVTNGEMRPVTSNAVFDTISAIISKGAQPTPTLTPIGANADIVTTSDDITIAGVNIGRLGNNAIHFAWTTGGYIAICVDTTVVAAIGRGNVIK